MKLMAAATASAGLIANFKDEEAVASGTGWCAQRSKSVH